MSKGYDPNQPRDKIGRWTLGFQAAMRKGAGLDPTPQKFIQELREAKTEIAYIQDGNGNIIDRQEGDPESVDLKITKKTGDKLNIIHNHPDQSGISIGDLRYAGHHENINKFTIVTKAGIQEVTIQDPGRLWRELNQVENWIAEQISEGTINGIITKENKTIKKIEITNQAIYKLAILGIIKIESHP